MNIMFFAYHKILILSEILDLMKNFEFKEIGINYVFKEDKQEAI